MQKLKQSIISLLEQKGTELSTAEIMQNVSKEYVLLKIQGKNNEAIAAQGICKSIGVNTWIG